MVYMCDYADISDLGGMIEQWQYLVGLDLRHFEARVLSKNEVMNVEFKEKLKLEDCKH